MLLTSLVTLHLSSPWEALLPFTSLGALMSLLMLAVTELSTRLTVSELVGASSCCYTQFSIILIIFTINNTKGSYDLPDFHSWKTEHLPQLGVPLQPTLEPVIKRQ